MNNSTLQYPRDKENLQDGAKYQILEIDVTGDSRVKSEASWQRWYIRHNGATLTWDGRYGLFINTDLTLKPGENVVLELKCVEPAPSSPLTTDQRLQYLQALTKHFESYRLFIDARIWKGEYTEIGNQHWEDLHQLLNEINSLRRQINPQ